MRKNDPSPPSRPPLQVLEEDQSLQGPQRKSLLEDRKKELLTQQKASENEHLQILDTMAKHGRVEFQQTLLQDRQGFEKALLQEVWLIFPLSCPESLSTCHLVYKKFPLHTSVVLPNLES